MSQLKEEHLQTPDLPSHEHGRKQTFGDAPRHPSSSS